MRLLDKRRQVIVDVADNLVNDALTSGNYELRPGVRIPVTLPDGTVGDLDSEEMPKALQMGVRYRTAAEDREAAQAEIQAIRKEAADMPVTAAGLGALRGATFGLSDVAIRAGLGKETAEFAREVRDVSPTASIAGEIVGGIAGLATGAPVAAATAAGAKAASVIGRGAQQLTAVQKMGRALVGGTVEGAAIGAGQTVSEMALADPELTTQKALANVGLGALFGGGLSVAGRGALEGAKAASVGLLAAAAKTDLATKPAEFAARQIAEVYGAASGAVKQIDDPLWKKLWDKGSKKFREIIIKAMDNPRAVLEGVAEQFDDIKNFFNDLSVVAREGADIQAKILDSQTGRTPKKVLKALDDDDAAEFGVDAILEDRVIKGPNLVKAEKEAGFEVFDRIQAKGKELVQRGDDLLAKMRETNAADRSFDRTATYDDFTIRDLASRLEDFSTNVAGATKPSQVARAMTTFKNETAQLFKIPKGKTLDLIKTENRPLWEAIEAVRPFWAEVKDTTISKDVFGDLGSAMARRAEIINNVLTATDDLLGRFYRITPGKTMNAREYVPDMAKINSFIINPDAARNAVKAEAIERIKTRVRDAVAKLEPLDIKASQDDLARLQRDLAKVERIPANKKGAANKQEKIDFLKAKIDDIQRNIDDATQFNANIESFKKSAIKRVDGFEQAFNIATEKRQAILMLNRLEAATGRSLIGGAAGAGLAQLGGLVGIDTGPVATGIGLVSGLALGNPKAMLKYLSAMENAADGFDRMAKNASEKFVKFDKKIGGVEGVIGKAVPAVRQTYIRDKLRMEPTERPQDDESAFRAHRKKLTSMQQDPEALMLRVMDNMGEDAMDSPRLLIETQATVTRGLSFLESKIPKDPYNPGVYPDDFVPSPVEMSHYGDYVQAVMKPKIILKQMSEGNINPRTVEAIKAVYPKMYDDLLTQVTGQLMKPEKASFQARIQLGILFGIPSVKAMQPDYLARMAALKQPQQAQQQQPQGNMAALNASNREQRV